MLDAHAAAGRDAVRRRRGADHEIDIDGVDACAHERLARGRDSEIGCQLALVGNVALLDAGTLADIQASLASTRRDRSSLAIIRLGRRAPTPWITDRMNATSHLSYASASEQEP